MLRLELIGNKSRGKPERGLIDVVKEKTGVSGGSEEDAEDGIRWRS